MSLEYPNLFIPGAAKSGTSTFHELLDKHPEICMSSDKEPFYWVRDDFDVNSKLAKQDYLSLFDSTTNVTYKGESSTSYMLFPNFIERIKTYNPNELKFIFVLRNPVDRLYSHYWYIKGIGDEQLDLKDAVLNDKDIEPNIASHHKNGKYKHYYQYGLYGKWLSNFFNAFKKDQIKIIVFEDFKNDPLGVLNSCFNFLKLNSLDYIPNLHNNETIVLKYPKLYSGYQDLTKGRLKLIKPLNKFVPRKIKVFLKKDVSNIIVEKTKTIDKYPSLTLEERNWIKNLYTEDFELLKEVTQLDFKLWEDFN
ncbi:sulfotransferase domain-containing protein [uncultured Psychroserpens sp.]|uniref:sulfotransferase domain-containing protein n=1 Tax=uncultured Psychroserpens sp. TaxID=255436 RepID=UPI00261A9FBA|nr:sulfotransferase domain-containing protein [uncultured Psychroserpens sp.]